MWNPYPNSLESKTFTAPIWTIFCFVSFFPFIILHLWWHVFQRQNFLGGRGFIGTNSAKLWWINLKSTGTYMEHMKQRLASAHINDNDDPLIFHAWLGENSWCYKGKNNLAWKPRSSLQDRCFIRPLRQYSLHFPISAFWGGKIAKQTHKQNLTGKYNHSPVCSRPDQLNPVLTLLLCVMHSKLIQTSSHRNGKKRKPQKTGPHRICCKVKRSGKNPFHFHRKWWNLWWKYNCTKTPGNDWSG